MASVNKWIGIGNIAADPEIKYLPSGEAVTNFTIACNENWTKDGEKKERTEFVKCVAWKRLAEICGEYLKKGKEVYIEGKLQTRSWDKDGVKHYMTEIHASYMQMLGSKGDPIKPSDNNHEDIDIPF